MQYMRGWGAMTSDPEWKGKVFNASLMILCGMCIPLVGPIVLRMVLLGWGSLMLRRAVSGQDSPLPRLDWDMDYLGKLLNGGFKSWLAALVWSMPLTFVMIGSVCCMYVAFFGAAASLAGGAASGSDVGAGLGGIAGMCMMIGFLTIYPIVLFLFQMPIHVALLRAKITDDINTAIRPKDVLDMTKLLFWELLKGQFVFGLLGMVAVMFGLITLYVGLFPAVVVLQILHMYWYAELYKRYLEKGGVPLPIGPLTVEGEDAIAQHPGGPPPGQWGPPPQTF